MYINWSDFFELAYAFANNLTDKEEDAADSYEYSSKFIIYHNLMPVGAKIMAMVGVDSYVIDMEAAAFMRYNCIELSRWILL